MLLPGYYVAGHSLVLQTDDKIYKIRIYAGDWLVTNGIFLGRFDKTKSLDWLPLEWTRGNPVELNERLSNQLEAWCRQVVFRQLEVGFKKLVSIAPDNPDEPIPDMPRPPIRDGLGTYLRTRRTMFTASARKGYDYR